MQNLFLVFFYMSGTDRGLYGHWESSFTENKFIAHIFIKRIPNKKCVMEMFKLPLTSTLVGMIKGTPKAYKEKPYHIYLWEVGQESSRNHCVCCILH